MTKNWKFASLAGLVNFARNLNLELINYENVVRFEKLLLEFGGISLNFIVKVELFELEAYVMLDIAVKDRAAIRINDDDELNQLPQKIAAKVKVIRGFEEGVVGSIDVAAIMPSAPFRNDPIRIDAWSESKFFNFLIESNEAVDVWSNSYGSKFIESLVGKVGDPEFCVVRWCPAYFGLRENASTGRVIH